MNNYFAIHADVQALAGIPSFRAFFALLECFKWEQLEKKEGIQFK